MAMKIIREADAGSVDRWQVPSVDATAAAELAGAKRGSSHLLTAGQLDALQRQVHEEAYQAGFAQGLAEGRRELESRAARFAGLIDALAYPFEVLDETVESELAALAVALASQLLRRELEREPEELTAMVKACLAILPVGTRDVVVRMNPDDEALVRMHLPAADTRDWALESDGKLGRGDLSVVSASSQIDGRLRARLEALLAEMDAQAD